ncbi:MAG: amidohydrolase family protein [Thermoplasmatota archaeon]
MGIPKDCEINIESENIEDIVLRNCKIISSKNDQVKRADIIIENGTINEIVHNRGHSRSTNNGAFEIDLNGAYVMTSFIDAHMHLLQWSTSKEAVDLGGCTSKKSVKKALGDVIDGKRNNLYFEMSGVLFGVDMDESKFENKRDMTMDRQFLDTISEDHPIIIRRICGHKVYLNTLALDVLTDLEEPSNDGILLEKEAMRISWGPNLKPTETGKLIRTGIGRLYRMGVTGGTEIIPVSKYNVFREAYSLVPQKFKLTLSIDMENSEERSVRGEHHNSWERTHRRSNDPEVVFMKMFMDGSIGARTASFSEDYTDLPKVDPIISIEALKEQLHLSEELGLVPMVHAIGDRAVRRAVEHLTDLDGIFRIEHFESTSSGILKMLSGTQGAVCMQPNFARNWGMKNGMYERALGKKYQNLNAFGDIFHSNIHCCFGTDMMPPGPIYAIKGSVSHSNPIQRIPLLRSIEAFTDDSFKYSLLGDRKGISEGESPDLIAVKKDLSKVLITISDGSMVYMDQQMKV